MKYRIGICDDEVSTCSNLERYIMDFFREQIDNVEVYVWNTAEEFIKDVPLKVNIDILFLDIELPKKNGVDVGYYIRENLVDEGMHIIFISSKTSYALELFDIHPYNFWVKPIKKDKVFNDIQKLLQIENQDKRFFSYTYNRNKYKILIGDIIYFKCDKHHIKIVCRDGEKIYVGKLKSEIEKLPKNFVMVSQSNIINIRHIRKCIKSEVIMDNGDSIKISKNYRKEFNAMMLEGSNWGELKNGYI